MRLEFQLTFEDYCEAYDSHATAASRPTNSAKVRTAFWQLSGALATGTLAAIYNPWQHTNGVLGWIVPAFVMPMTPWVFVFARSLSIQLGSPRKTSAIVPPWQSMQHSTSLARAWLTMSVIAWPTCMAFSIYEHSIEPNSTPGFIAFVFGCSVAFFAYFIYFVYTGVLKSGRTFRQIQNSWNWQTHLQEPNVVEIDHAGIVMDSLTSRMEFKWLAYTGFVETSKAFLLYRSTIQFHIVPKRAFSSPEMMNAFHNILATLVGKKPSAFPVLLVANAQEDDGKGGR